MTQKIPKFTGKKSYKVSKTSKRVGKYLARVTGTFEIPEGMTQEELMWRIKWLEDNPYDHSIRFY